MVERAHAAPRGSPFAHALGVTGKGAGGLGLLLLIATLLSACTPPSRHRRPRPPHRCRRINWPYDIVLAEPSWLAEHLNDPDIRIVDVSDQPQYLLGHVPGAVHAYWQDLVERNSPTYGRLAGRPDREKVFGNLGIEQKTLVIVYDRNDNRAAARFAWALWYAGHPNVRILNGGLAGLGGDGLRNRSARHTPRRTSSTRDLPDESLLINRCDMSKAITDPQAVILDVRTDSEMTQTWDNTTQIGSIPNAHRLPWTAFIRDPNVPAFRSPMICARCSRRRRDAGSEDCPLWHLQQRRRAPLLRPQGARLRERQTL